MDWARAAGPNKRKGKVGRFDGRNGGGGKRRMRRPAGLFSFYKKNIGDDRTVVQWGKNPMNMDKIYIDL